MPRTYTLTYDQVTPESAEDGDFSDCGFGVPGTLTATSVREGGCISDDTEVRRAALAAASAAATEAIEDVDAEELGWHRFPEDTAEVAQSRYACERMADLIRDHYGATEYSSAGPGVDGSDAGGWYTTPDGSTDYRTGEQTLISVHLDGWTADERRAIYARVKARR